MTTMEHSGNRPGEGARSAGRESVIDHDCYFEGTFRTPGNMRIDGTYKGVIECHGTLLIAETGQVNARIVAGSLLVSGELSGEVQCESRFELLKSGRVSGSVATKTVVVHDGAFFEGEVRMGAEPVAPRPSQPAAVPAAEKVDDAPAESAPAGRRRSGQDAPRAAAATAADGATADDGGAPRINGRSQTGNRDIVPNRTGEPPE
jgi:cytoskeletal protein CcmA (bactofilin family)